MAEWSVRRVWDGERFALYWVHAEEDAAAFEDGLDEAHGAQAPRSWISEDAAWALLHSGDDHYMARGRSGRRVQPSAYPHPHAW